MRILLFGKGGQLGWEACRTLNCLGEVVAMDAPEVDFTHPERLTQIVEDVKPDVIYNAAAFTAVDQAESEVKKAHLINAVAVGALAEAAVKTKALLVHFSTDYVFDGKKETAYLETDATGPINVYGRTKLEGEQYIQQAGGAHIILRTAWVYSRRPESFVGKVLNWSRKNEQLKVVSDQVGSPTWARLLAEITALMLAQGKNNLFAWGLEKQGLYHLAGEGQVNRFDWAKQILALDPKADEQICRELLAAKTDEFPTPAARPLNSALNNNKFRQTFGLSLGDWQHGLELAMH